MASNAPLTTNDSGIHEDPDEAENGTSWHGGMIEREYNPLPHVLPEGDNAAPLEVMGSTADDKLVIIMVGLPATGKTHIAKRICRFLSFFHDIPSQIFNVGDYRRQLCGAQQPASFYNPENKDGVAQRKVACDAALADLMEYMNQDGVRVAALDATNSTRERRNHITSTLKKGKNNIKTIFVESICDDEAVSISLVVCVCSSSSSSSSNIRGGQRIYIALYWNGMAWHGITNLLTHSLTLLFYFL